MYSGIEQWVQFSQYQPDFDEMYNTWSLWTSFLRSANRSDASASVTPEPDTLNMTGNDHPDETYVLEKIPRVNFSDSPKVEEVVLPLDWAEYLIFKERMHRRRSTGSHIIRGIKRLRIKRLRSERWSPITDAKCGVTIY